MSKVIVIGSINMDVVAFTKRHPKSGETVLGTDLKYFPGGKGANQAVASAKLGAKTMLVGKVGEDLFGNQLLQFLDEQHIETQISKTSDAPTGVGFITVATDTSDNTIVVVFGANFKLTKEEVENIPLEKGDVLVGQFEVPHEVTEFFFRRGKEVGTTNIFNAAPAQHISLSLMSLIDILVVNETELEVVSGRSVDVNSLDSVIEAAKQVRQGSRNLVVTIGDKGAIVLTQTESFTVPGRKVQAVDTTGAGDCFIGAVASQIAQGNSLADAIKFANIAASISVTREGAGPSMPTLEEVQKLL